MQWSRVQPHSYDDNFSLISVLADAIQSQPIAVAALILAIVVGLVGYIHNRHSVRPLLRFRAENYFDKLSFKITLRNVGLGPAIITKWSMYKDGALVQTPILESEWFDFLQGVGITDVNIDYWNIFVGQAFAPRGDDIVVLLHITASQPDLLLATPRDIRHQVNRLNFICEYKSVYRFSGQKEPFTPPKTYKKIVQYWQNKQVSDPGDAANGGPAG